MNKKYQIILCDAPWHYKKSGGIKSARGLAKKYYKEMDIQDIIDLPVSSIADKDCYLFLWVTGPRMPEGIAVLKAWGFEFFTVVFTWIKMNKKNTKTLFWGMGKSSRANPEYVLLGRKGKLERKARNVHSVIMSPIEEHSKKPDEIRRRIELLYGDLPRIELFARKPKDVLFQDKSWNNWNVWGNECNSDIEL